MRIMPFQARYRRQVNDQLAVMRQPDWMNSRVLAIGPRFPREWSRDVIAADFKYGIAHMVRLGLLNATSNFVGLLNANLDTLIANGGPGTPLYSQSPPHKRRLRSPLPMPFGSASNNGFFHESQWTSPICRDGSTSSMRMLVGAGGIASRNGWARPLGRDRPRQPTEWRGGSSSKMRTAKSSFATRIDPILRVQ